MAHPDEGLLHAWLDGQLPPEDAARLEQRIATDPQWAAAAADAQGILAAASRLLLALDSMPSAAGAYPVMPRTPPARPGLPGETRCDIGDVAARPVRRRRWRPARWMGVAATAVLVTGLALGFPRSVSKWEGRATERGLVPSAHQASAESPGTVADPLAVVAGASPGHPRQQSAAGGTTKEMFVMAERRPNEHTRRDAAQDAAPGAPTVAPTVVATRAPAAPPATGAMAQQGAATTGAPTGIGGVPLPSAATDRSVNKGGVAMAVAVGVTENASAEPPRAVPVTHQALAVSPASSTLGGQVVPVAPSIVATARPAPRGSGARAHEAVVVRDSLAGACYLLRDQDTQTDLPPQMRVVQSAGDTVHLESAVPMLVAREAWLVERGDVWRGVLVQPRTGPAQRADPVAARAVVGVRVPCSTR